MKMKVLPKCFGLSVLLMLAASLPTQGSAQAAPATVAGSNADYLGQPLPGDRAVVFAPGIVSNGHVHGRLVVSPDGREILWTDVKIDEGIVRIMGVARTEHGWTAPTTPAFAGQGMSSNPLFSPDGGRKLYFAATPDLAKGWKAQVVVRTAAGWTVPKESEFLLKTSSSFTDSGRVYYSDTLAGKPWDQGIYAADYTGTAYENARALPAEINSPYIDYGSFVAPDERFLLLSSSRPSAKEDMYLYVSFRNADGTWTEPRKLNDAIGFNGNARFPSLSPDGKFLFFCGDDGNVYWVRSSVIDSMRQHQ
jgi:hypothetical protein